MNQIIKIFIIFCFICLFSFVSLFQSIKKNKIIFTTDEIYWIQTARIVPYIIDNNFKDIYWHEHVGFTNFMGAKWIYGIGFSIFGLKDFSPIQYPPGHYEQFKSFDGLYFPESNNYYIFLYYGRIISAVIGSICIGLLFIISYLLYSPNYIAISIVILLSIYHPTILYISKHALADTVFLASQLMTMIFGIIIFKRIFFDNVKIYILLGIAMGYGLSTKINGFMFILLFYINVLIWVINYPHRAKIQYKSLIIIIMSTILTFFILQPNLFFYSKYSLLQMILDRIFITRHQMNYFSLVDPSHVLFTIPQRIFAMNHHVFTQPIRIHFYLGIISLLLGVAFNSNIPNRQLHLLQIINVIIIGLILLMYVVFDDARYFLPLLPYVLIISASWTSYIYNIFHKQTTNKSDNN